MRNYIITCQSGTRCLVRHSSEDAALKAWDGADPARSIERASRSEALDIARGEVHDYRKPRRSPDVDQAQAQVWARLMGLW